MAIKKKTKKDAKDDISCDKFHKLCLDDAAMRENDGDGIGTYNEKRFHRIFKRFVSEDASCYEIRVGSYVADVLCDGHVTEIQTTSYSKLAPKIKYYLENTDYTVTVVRPLPHIKWCVWLDENSGEVVSKKRSPKKALPKDVLRDWIYLCPSL